MSALAADAAFLEKAGTPVAAIGGEALIRTVGRAMARAHGFKDYPFVSLPLFMGEGITDEALRAYVEQAVPQIERVLSRSVETGKG